MKKFFTIFFVVLGVLFLLQLMALAYFFIADPLNLKPLLFPEDSQTSEEERVVEESADMNTESVPSQEDAPAAAPAISPAQSAALEAVGVEAETVLSFTPEQQACFETKLGAARVAEIKAGAVPTFAEFTIARECL